MMKTMFCRACALPLALACAVVPGCREEAPKNSTKAASSQGAATLPGDLFTAVPLADSKDVLPTKREAKKGERVVVRGRIGGSTEPFVGQRAIFTLADLSMPTCAQKGDDGCPTPWDYCCEPPNNITANTLTVQVVGADGKPLKTGLKGVSGLQPMAEVVVDGLVSQKPDDGTVTIDATGIFVKKP